MSQGPLSLQFQLSWSISPGSAQSAEEFLQEFLRNFWVTSAFPRTSYPLHAAATTCLVRPDAMGGLLGQARTTCCACHHLLRHFDSIHRHLLSTSLLVVFWSLSLWRRFNSVFALKIYFLVKVLVLTYQGYQGYVRWNQSGFLRKVSRKLLITGGFNYIVASPV